MAVVIDWWENSNTDLFDVSTEPKWLGAVGVDQIVWHKGLATGKALATVVLNGILPLSEFLMRADDFGGLTLDIVYHTTGRRAVYDPSQVIIRFSQCALAQRELVRPVIYHSDHVAPMIVKTTLDCSMEIFWERWDSLR